MFSDYICCLRISFNLIAVCQRRLLLQGSFVRKCRRGLFNLVNSIWNNRRQLGQLPDPFLSCNLLGLIRCSDCPRQTRTRPPKLQQDFICINLECNLKDPSHCVRHVGLCEICPSPMTNIVPAFWGVQCPGGLNLNVNLFIEFCQPIAVLVLIANRLRDHPLFIFCGRIRAIYGQKVN